MNPSEKHFLANLRYNTAIFRSIGQFGQTILVLCQGYNLNRVKDKNKRTCGALRHIYCISRVYICLPSNHGKKTQFMRQYMVPHGVKGIIY